jgi:hypothetical protein
MGLALKMHAHFQKGCLVSFWARVRNTPSWSKSHLKFNNFGIGGALARREQPPEPQQITSDNWLRLAEKSPTKGGAGASKRQAHGPKLCFSIWRRASFTKAAQNYAKQPV